MSNEMKEWLKDRQEQAFDDISTIAELFEEHKDQEYIYHCIRKILKDGKWI